MLLKDKFAAFAVVFIWGINFYFMKVGISEISPMLLGCLRYVLVLLPALFFVAIPKVGWKWLLLYGFISNFSQFAFMFSAIATGMPTGLVALVVQSQAFFTVMIAVWVLKENASWNQWLAIVIASFGLALIALGQQHSHVPLLGLLLVLGSALSWACGNIVVKQIGQVNPIGLVVWGNILTPVWFLLLALHDQGWQGILADYSTLTWKGFTSAAFLAYFATIIGYGLWIYLLTRYPAAKISPLSLWVPVISMLFAAVFLDEQLNAWQWLGSGVIMCGLIVHLFGQKFRLLLQTQSVIRF
ncbi:EamA family transporter [Acinetobacter sp. FDAARGOS_515]|uniref:EamA family transporter n=1 Tax=Acinetobacter sp. FDAARGOS_515 TaxID=2420307 RepID=UPI000F66E5E6|nr:EamA family transporter [Acinetobacter sp. FDAARGOS_515]RSC22406.1 EamA family transporter [Acinetobacter sp. FDAARGOS_515]